MILAEAAEHMGYVQETLEILTSPAHLTAEIIIEVVGNIIQVLIFWPVIKWAGKRFLAKHDREVHGA